MPPKRAASNANANAAAGDDQTFKLRYKRQVGNSEDQAYSLEISFPTVDDEEVANDAGKTVNRMLQLALENRLLLN